VRYQVNGERSEKAQGLGARVQGLGARVQGHGLSDPGFRSLERLALSPTPSALDANPSDAGLTLIELIITITIVSVLASAAIPVARFQVRREKERELRRDLWEMRDAIDKYKDAADKGAFVTQLDSINYPPDLETLVNGVDIQGKTVRFLRRIPVDPMTKQADWGLRSNQDDPDSDSWGGQNVFDVHTKSDGIALDGSKYSTW
jgi:general secretion pathway protein G